MTTADRKAGGDRVAQAPHNIEDAEELSSSAHLNESSALNVDTIEVDKIEMAAKEEVPDEISAAEAASIVLKANDQLAIEAQFTGRQYENFIDDQIPNSQMTQKCLHGDLRIFESKSIDGLTEEQLTVMIETPRVENPLEKPSNKMLNQISGLELEQHLTMET